MWNIYAVLYGEEGLGEGLRQSLRSDDACAESLRIRRVDQDREGC